MKKWIPAVLLSAAALAFTTAVPADAATRSITVPYGTGPAAVDTKTKLVYVGTTPPEPPNPDPGPGSYSSAGVAKIDPAKKKVIKSVLVNAIETAGNTEFLLDVKVSPISKDLWVLVGIVDNVGGCYASLYQLKKTTLKTVRSYPFGCAKKIELDPTSRRVYLTEAPHYDALGVDDPPPYSPGTVVAIDGATGHVSRATLPSPSVPAYAEGYFPTTVAFDSGNHGVYVAGQSRLWKYTTKLKLVQTSVIDYPADASLRAAANGSTNLIYLSDQVKLTEISGPSGNVRRTSVLGGGSTMVIDTKSNVLYLGQNTVKLSTLLATGKQQPFEVQSVDPTTHARYSFGSSQLQIKK